MPEGNRPKDAWRAWLFQIRRAVSATPFRPPAARVSISVTPAMAREILDALRPDEQAVRHIDCAGRPTKRLMLDGVTVEWLAVEPPAR